MISLSPSLIGHKKIQDMLGYAPVRLLITLRGWLAAERNRYVGNSSGKDGLFRRQIKALKRGKNATNEFRRNGKWLDMVAKAFKGYIINKNSIDNLTLRMGAGLLDRSKFMRGMAMMDASYTGSGIIASKKYMALPVYKNLQKLGINDNFRKHFVNLFKTELTPIKGKNDTILWFEKDMTYKRKREGQGQFKRSALLFIGKKQVKLRKHFDFSKQFYGQADAIRRRGITALNRTIDAMNRGYQGTGPNIFEEGGLIRSGRTVITSQEQGY